MGQRKFISKCFLKFVIFSWHRTWFIKCLLMLFLPKQSWFGIISNVIKHLAIHRREGIMNLPLFIHSVASNFVKLNHFVYLTLLNVYLSESCMCTYHVYMWNRRDNIMKIWKIICQCSMSWIKPALFSMQISYI